MSGLERKFQNYSILQIMRIRNHIYESFHHYHYDKCNVISFLENADEKDSYFTNRNFKQLENEFHIMTLNVMKKKITIFIHFQNYFNEATTTLNIFHH